MQRDEFASGRLQVEQLMNVGNVCSGDCTGRPAMSVVRPDSSFFVPIVHRFGELAFADEDDPDRSAVIVNRGTMPRPPAKKQQFGELAAGDQVPRVLAGGEHAMRFVIVSSNHELREPVLYFGEGGDS